MAGIFGKKETEKKVEETATPVVEALPSETDNEVATPTAEAKAEAEIEKKEEVEETATPVVEALPSSKKTESNDLTEMVLDHEDRIEGLESLTEKVAELSPEALRLSALFELHLKAAGTKLGKELGSQLATAAEKSQSAIEKAQTASEDSKQAIKIAKSIEASTDEVLVAANTALDAAGSLDEALTEMRAIGKFVDRKAEDVDKKLDEIKENLAEFEAQIDEKLAEFRKELQAMFSSSRTTTTTKTHPWERG